MILSIHFNAVVWRVILEYYVKPTSMSVRPILVKHRVHYNVWIRSMHFIVNAIQVIPGYIARRILMNALRILAEIKVHATIFQTVFIARVRSDLVAYFVKPISMNVPRSHVWMEEHASKTAGQVNLHAIVHATLQVVCVRFLSRQSVHLPTIKPASYPITAHLLLHCLHLYLH